MNSHNFIINVLFRQLYTTGKLFYYQSLSRYIRSRLSCRKLRGTSSSFTSAQERNISRRNAMPEKDKKGATKEPKPISGPVTRDKNGLVVILIHAKPGSKQNAVTDVSADYVGVAIAAPPSDGEANAELVRYLSKILEVKKSEVVLDKGCRSRDKKVKILGSLSPEEVVERLKREAAV